MWTAGSRFIYLSFNKTWLYNSPLYATHKSCVSSPVTYALVISCWVSACVRAWWLNHSLSAANLKYNWTDQPNFYGAHSWLYPEGPLWFIIYEKPWNLFFFFLNYFYKLYVNTAWTCEFNEQGISPNLAQMFTWTPRWTD